MRWRLAERSPRQCKQLCQLLLHLLGLLLQHTPIIHHLLSTSLLTPPHFLSLSILLPLLLLRIPPHVLSLSILLPHLSVRCHLSLLLLSPPLVLSLVRCHLSLSLLSPLQFLSLSCLLLLKLPVQCSKHRLNRKRIVRHAGLRSGVRTHGQVLRSTSPTKTISNRPTVATKPTSVPTSVAAAANTTVPTVPTVTSSNRTRVLQSPLSSKMAVCKNGARRAC